MQKLKNFIKFLWNDLYNKHSILVVNIYNLVATAWNVFLIIDMYKHQHEEGLALFFVILLTFCLNAIIYFICHIIFFIETKKNKKMKDNPIIKSKLYRVISILSICIVGFNYLLFPGCVYCIILLLV